MGRILIGTGGWDYFSIPQSDRLGAYSSAYDFVEVNSTYYRLPRPATAASWRTRVPSKFEFAVRCHRHIAEGSKLELDSKAVRIVDSIEKICRYLRANVLAVLVPKTVVADSELAPKLKAFLSSLSLGKTKLALEFRGAKPTDDVLNILRDNDAIHSVDISTSNPLAQSTTLYTRLFGSGEGNVYEFDDNELKNVAAKANSPKFEKSILAFHGVRMYRDAARLKIYLDSGKFPSLTGQVGLDSLGEVLKEDTVFPITKARLVKVQGWKLFDSTTTKRIRASEVLRKLPDKTYQGFGDLRASLDRVIS
jgi:uncharacterized protein YecE (DUF72 family)